MSGPGREAVPDRESEMSLAGLAGVLLRHRRLVVGVAIGFALVTGAIGLLTSRTWTSAATFMPQGRRPSAAGLTGLAAQLGITVPTVDAGQGPGFYADFVTSRTMLGALADTTFEFQADTGLVRATLGDIYHVRGSTAALRREALIRKLQDKIQAVPVVKTGVVRVRVTAAAADLARQMVGLILDRLNWFNLVTRQSQAGTERRFMEDRLNDSRGELRAAEDRLQRFLQRNRDYRNSPELAFQQDRLAREVDMRQQVHTSLTQAFEQARIEEVRDTPVITIVEQPEVPARPDGRGIVSYTVVALVGGGLLGALLAIFLAALERERAVNATEMLAVQSEFREALFELRRPWRLLRRRRRDD